MVIFQSVNRMEIAMYPTLVIGDSIAELSNLLRAACVPPKTLPGVI